MVLSFSFVFKTARAKMGRVTSELLGALVPALLDNITSWARHRDSRWRVPFTHGYGYADHATKRNGSHTRIFSGKPSRIIILIVTKSRLRDVLLYEK